MCPDHRALGFTVATQDAPRVRRALSHLPGCRVSRCDPFATARLVCLRIEYPALVQQDLVRALLACVPGGILGRIAPA